MAVLTLVPGLRNLNSSQCQTPKHLLRGAGPTFRNEEAAQRVRFGAGYPADVWGSYSGQKLQDVRNPGRRSIPALHP